MAETADSVDDELARKLNGRTTFDGQAGGAAADFEPRAAA